MIWVVGHRGMLGKELSLLLGSRGMEHFGSGRESNIADLQSLRRKSAGFRIDWIVNCLGYTSVEGAEDDEDAAWKVNADGARNIAVIASEHDAKLINISTDYVFSGTSDLPYVEDDPIAPMSAYGRTKAEGEALVREACGRHYILRTSWLYGRYGDNFVHKILGFLARNGEASVVNDQRGSPTWANDLAGAIAAIISSDSESFGTYHYADEGEATWYDFACEICRLGQEAGILGKGSVVRPINTAQYPSKVKRPRYSALSTRKIREVFGILPPSWQDSLEVYIGDLEMSGIPPDKSYSEWKER